MALASVALAMIGGAYVAQHHARPEAVPSAQARQCADAGLTLMLALTPATARVGQPLDVRLRVKNSGGRTCTRSFDSFTVTSQWREPTPYHQSTCTAGAAQARTLQPGEEFEWAATTWAAAPGGCPWAAEPVVALPPGAWHGTVTAHYADRSSTVTVTITNT
jgi:hypothetical protein